MKGPLIALQFLTRLPTPRIAVSGEEFAASIRWFPAAGLIVGLLVAGGALLGAQLDPWLGALAALVLWVGLTGGLHLDGLGDISDALGAAHKDRDALRAVLADPHMGSFGVIAIALQLIAKLVLLRLAVEDGAFAALAAIPFAARIGPLFWARRLEPLHPGLGARFRDSVRRADLLLWAALLALTAVLLAPALLAALPLLLLWERALRRSLGGISGDAHGAGIELLETGLLLALTVAARLG